MGDGEMLGDGGGGGRAGGEGAGGGLAQRGVPGRQREQAAGQFRDGATGFAILLQMPFQGGPEGGPIRDAVQLRHIRVAQRGNPRFGQDVLQQRIAVRGTVLLRIGEFQQLGIEQPVQFLVQGRRHPPREPMQPVGGAVRSGLGQERRGAVPERHGHAPHQVDGMLIPIPAEGLPVQGERPTEGKMPVDEPGNAGAARRDVRVDAMVHGMLQGRLQFAVHDRSPQEGEESPSDEED